MQFLNPWLAAGLLSISIPIIIHVLNRQSGRTVDWGAIQFLRDSMVIRNRRIRLEEALLMAARCLLMALLAAAIARPYVPPGASVPWFLVLPLFLLAAVAAGLAVVLWDMPRVRWGLLAGVAAAILLCGTLITLEERLNLSRFSSGGKQDIALILDASTSMSLAHEGRTNLDRAVEEARTLVRRSPRGTAWSLIVAGPTPSARILIPTTDRERVLEELDHIPALDGGMAAYDSLTLAALGLAQGSNPSRQILVITDGQKVGWEVDQPARWTFLKDAWANLPSLPRLIVRQMPLPSDLRNLSVTGVQWSREIIGVDRPVEITVTVENTGSESVSPQGVELTIGDQTFTDQSLGQLSPGATSSLTFTHQFNTAGAHEASARVLVSDEVPRDDSMASAVQVTDELRVLLVDGNPGGKFLERATGFAALALAPGVSTTLTMDAPAEDDPMRFLVTPEVVPLHEVTRIVSFDAWDAVILADVPRLPKDSTLALEAHLKSGGGVLIAAGPRAEADFYNGWLDQDGNPLLPARLEEQIVTDGQPENSVHPSLATFRHSGLTAISDPRVSDLENATLTHYWKLAELPDVVTGARLSNGDPWLVARTIGRGNLVVLGSSLDARSGTLPGRQAFVPFMHELVYFLSDPGRYQLNLDPEWELALHLSANEHTVAGFGLRGEYRPDRKEDGSGIERLDPAIHFNWRGGAPADDLPNDHFHVTWRGKLQPEQSGKYRFDSEVDDSISVRIDGQEVYRCQTNGRNEKARSVWLEANRLHDIQIEYEEEDGGAMAVLYWESEQISREIVPPEVFRPLGGTTGEGEVIATYEVTDPLGEPRLAAISATAGGAVARIQGDVSAGPWQLKIPEEERVKFPDLLGEGQNIIPFTVKRDPAESRLEPWSPEDVEFLQNQAGMALPESPEEVLSILSGESWGEELWKYLAVGALAFLLLEIGLSRWIAASRRAEDAAAVQMARPGTPGF